MRSWSVPAAGRDDGDEDLRQQFGTDALLDQLHLRIRQRRIQLLFDDADAGDEHVALHLETGPRLSGRQRLLLLHWGGYRSWRSFLLFWAIWALGGLWGRRAWKDLFFFLKNFGEELLDITVASRLWRSLWSWRSFLLFRAIGTLGGLWKDLFFEFLVKSC